MDDVFSGVRRLIDEQDALTFLGTLITVEDTNYDTVDPLVRSEVPPKVMSIVDGQQRLTTLLVLNVSLHNAIRNRYESFSGSDDEAETWLYGQSADSMIALTSTFEDDRGRGAHRYFPKIARAYDDRWSRNEGEALYKSPIADFLKKYSDHHHSDATKGFEFPHSESVGANFRWFGRHLQRAVARGEGDFDFPSTEEIVTGSSFAGALFGVSFSEEVRARLLEEPTGSYAELLRLVAFANFALERIALTLIVAKREEYAFDMFEALNTTGEPLTAVETFRPRVIEFETRALYESSDSRRSMGHVDDFVGQFRKAEDRQKATTALLAPFAMAEEGEKMRSRLNDQRRFLQGRLEKFATVEGKRDFVQQLGNTALVLDSAWSQASGVAPSLPNTQLSGEAKMCLSVLLSAKHSIVLGLITRFYSRHRQNLATVAELESAIRSVTAFFALWRGAHGGTAGIDGIYRRLMGRGAPELGVPPFARTPVHKAGQPEFSASEPDSAALQRFFQHELEKAGIGDRKRWSTQTAEVDVYESSQPLTRLLLLAATHDTVPDGNEPGLQKGAKKGVLELLTYDRWVDRASVTVEHVAPRAGVHGWDPELYEDPKVKGRLGNLILVAQAENSILSNRNWEEKRAIYQVLAAQSVDDAVKNVEAAAAIGITIPETLIQRESYIPLTSAISRRNGDWSLSFVSDRSVRLAELAWDRLSPWIGIKP